MFEEYVQPSVQLFGIRVDEPITTLTDLAVSAVCFFAFFSLRRIPVENKVQLYLKYYFLSMGFATAIGGLAGHAFLYSLSFYWKLPGWLTSMFSIALVERAAIEYARPLVKPRVGRFFAWLNVMELVTFMTITFITLNFFFVEVHTTYGLLIVVAGFSFYVYRKTRRRGSLMFLFAVGFSAIAALFFMNKWGISPWYNHFDISHTFLTVAAIFFYKGARRVVNEPIGREEAEQESVPG